MTRSTPTTSVDGWSRDVEVGPDSPSHPWRRALLSDPSLSPNTEAESRTQRRGHPTP